MKQKFIAFSPIFLFEIILRCIIIPYLFLVAAETILSHFGLLFAFSIHFEIVNIIAIGIFSILFLCNNLLWGRLQIRIMQQTEKKYVLHHFPYDAAFFSKKYRLYINIKSGYIGIISHLNPRTLQIFRADSIQNVDVTLKSKNNDTTSEVYFLTEINEQILRHYTLISNKAISTSSNEVKTCMQTAQNFCNYIREAQRTLHNPTRTIQIEKYRSTPKTVKAFTLEL